MKLKYEKNLLKNEPKFSIARIECLSISPNLTRLAVCTSANNHVLLYDGHTYEEKDKFALKSTAKNFSRKSFVVKGIAFSPDSLKLAIGQTDNVIYVYKIGEHWGDKKAIINKYSLQHAVTCLYWHKSGILFGSLDGKVKLVQTQTNKMSGLMSSQSSLVISMSVCGDTVVCGFMNGLIMMNSMAANNNNSRGDNTGKQVATHSCPPFALTMSQSGYICAAGCDGRITFINVSVVQNNNQRATGGGGNTSTKQNLEYGSDISCAISSTSGNIIILTSLEKLIVFELDSRVWRQKNTIELCGSYLVTGLQWSLDGTKLMVGTLNGAVELFACKWRTKLIGDKLEINYVGNRQVVVKDLHKGTTQVFQSTYDIKDVKIIKDSFVVVFTTNTLILSDITDESNNDKISEIDWTGMTTDGLRFSFDYENVVLINLVGELYLVELGSNQLLASVRTDFVNPHLMSVRINERKSGTKTLAYLLDIKTITILDLVSDVQLCVWSHNDRIDWIEMNETAKKLLFRDRSLKLNLLDIFDQESRVILNFCGFVQWVPGSDVCVGQSRDKLYVWYDFDKPVIQNVSGGSQNDAVGIERDNGVTKVLFAITGTDIQLDEVLLEFDTAIEDADLERAESFLESLSLTTESESMWRLLANVALKNSNLLIAERAFAAIGDISKATFVRECVHDYSKLALLDDDWSGFESSSADFDEVIDTYIRLHKWQRAIDYSVRSGRYETKQDLEQQYYNWLLDSGQEAEAGLIMEKSGKYEEAVKLYTRSGHLIQAGKLILNNMGKRGFDIQKPSVEQVIRDLVSSEFYEEAGQLLETNLVGDNRSALDNYIKGNAYAKAIALARKEFPDEVVGLELRFAEWLLNECNDPSGAVNHYIEAGKTDRALDAAIAAQQYDRAIEIASILDNIPAHYGKKIGTYYAGKDQIDTAIEIYLNSGCIRDAILLLNKKGQYMRAYKLALKLMDTSEAKEMYESIAKSLEMDGKYKEAEKIYITCDNVDSAISMYKNIRQFDSMVKLVKQYHPDLLNDTHLHLAKELETEGSLHQAESHYIAANEWKSAVQMYKKADNWDEAYRVSRTNGGLSAAKQVAYHWAVSLNNAEAAVKLLSRFGLLNQVVDYAVDANEFEFAKDLISNSGNELRHKMTEVKLKYAVWLEDEKRYSEAEVMYCESNKPKEAVLMYLHNGGFDEALRVAEESVGDEEVVKDVLTAQARTILERGRRGVDDMNRAEHLLLRAGRIEVAVKIYKDNAMWEEALRVCDQFAPHLVDAVKREMIAESRNSDIYMSGASTRQSSGKSSVVSMMSGGGSGGADSIAAGRHSAAYYNTDQPPPIMGNVGDLRQNLKLAEQNQDKDLIVKYTIMLCTQLVKDKSPVDALNLLTRYNAVFILPETKKIVVRIASDLLAFESDNDNDNSHKVDNNVGTWKQLRDSLYQVMGSSSSDSELEIIEKYMFVSHLFVLKTILGGLTGQTNAPELAMKITVALLRYTDIVRVDKAFYEAGLVAKHSNRLEMAFVYWNHFLDLVEAIDEGELDVDHSDFVGTDIPHEVPLPAQPFAASDQNTIEVVKSWILEVSMDTHVSQSLPLDALRDGDVYEASLLNADGSQCLPCLVTGYPVIKHKTLEFKPGKYAVNKDDWNKLLMMTKVTSNDDLKDVLHFVGKLGGNTNIAKFSFQ
ncbi:intraflagellar transport protein 172 homolog [Oppia nitens]|uniref:intraflagellar transport protein 172 homolog n=1 Tax=Oppia nitens TaxID=1686743 RepID=UPI0023DA490B|nr:intraflagellar transport protein 172 homolog [Oppia nitens]